MSRKDIKKNYKIPELREYHSGIIKNSIKKCSIPGASLIPISRSMI